MEALLFRHNLARYLASRVLFRMCRRMWSARLAPLTYAQLDPPEPTQPGWTKLRVTVSGICGSDLELVTSRDSLYLEPEATYPFVPGHELVGIVQKEVSGSRGDQPVDLHEGDRVAVWPVLGCRARGLSPPCFECADGWEGMCRRRHDGWPDSGAEIGYNRDTGGGWSEYCLAHVSQLWKLPETVADEDAVLLDPAATALASLFRTQYLRPERTLVIGAGTVGLLTAYLHSRLGLSGDCELIVRHEFQRQWALDRGLKATIVRDENAFHDWAADRSISSTRVPSYGFVYDGCFDRVVVAAGTRQSVLWGLRTVRPRGIVALIAAPVDLKGIDPTPIWYREIVLRGIYDYGPVPWESDWIHAYAVLIPKLADGTISFRGLITHEFPLREYPSAFRTLVDRGSTGAIKVVFRSGPGNSLRFGQAGY